MITKSKAEYDRQYRIDNIERIRERERERYWEDKSKKQRSAKKYYQKHKEEIKLRTKIWQENNPEPTAISKKKWSDNHREYENEKAKIWAKNNRISSREIKKRSEAKRRAIKNNVEVSVTTKEIKDLITKSKNICFWCNKYTETIHIDHIYPLSKGGEHTIVNLCVSCPDCNMKKHNKHPEKWLEEILNDN